MITVNDIIAGMDRWAPPDRISEGDKVGLMVGRKDAPVGTVLVALEINSAIIDEAITLGANMIICHHPIIYYPPLYAVTDSDHVGAMVMRLIENGIAVFAAHTNLDWAQGGVCDTLAQTIGLKSIQPLPNNEGRYGEISPMKLSDFAGQVKESLRCPAVKFVGDPERMISCIGVVAGGGGSYMDGAIKMGCEVFLSADFKYHEALRAEEIGLCLIDAGHFETENGIIYPIANYLKREYNNLTVVTSNREKSYYHYL